MLLPSSPSNTKVLDSLINNPHPFHGSRETVNHLLQINYIRLFSPEIFGSLCVFKTFSWNHGIKNAWHVYNVSTMSTLVGNQRSTSWTHHPHSTTWRWQHHQQDNIYKRIARERKREREWFRSSQSPDLNPWKDLKTDLHSHSSQSDWMAKLVMFCGKRMDNSNSDEAGRSQPHKKQKV